MNAQTKYFKNPERGQTVPFRPYIPNYKERGIEPMEAGVGVLPTATVMPPKRLPFAAQVLHKQPEQPKTKTPYAEPGPSVNVASVPNVGSDNEWFEDFSVVEGKTTTAIDPNQVMEDNNEYVSYANVAAGMPGSSPVEETKPYFVPTIKPRVQVEYTGPKTKEAAQMMNALATPEEVIEVTETPPAYIEYGQCVLMVEDTVIATAPLEEIESQVTALIFGEHPLFENQTFDADQIVVLKRVKIKVGVFIGE